MDNLNELITRAQAGDSEAEIAVLQGFAKMVKTIAFSYFVTCADRDSEDLVQVGMIALMRAVRTYKIGGDASFETYATHCVKYAIIDELRKSPAPSVPLEEVDDGTLSAPPPSLSWLAEAISSVLSDGERQVLELRLEAMSYAEIARELGIEKKKVDNLIASAKRKLKKFLGD